MSIRTCEHTKSRPGDAVSGSIFGVALHIWDPMVVSPPRSPEESPPEVTIADFSLEGPKTRLQPLESAVQTFLVEEEELFACSYLFFCREQQSTIVSDGAEGPRLNRTPVIPHLVYADMVISGSVVSSKGEDGVVFTLVDEESQKVADFEVYHDTIIVVHSSHSPMAVQAGQQAESTRLVFGMHHHQQLQSLHAEIESDNDLTYIPTTEILVGTGLERLPLRGNDEHRKVWTETKNFFRSMNSTVVRGIENHNNAEFIRAGVRRGEMLSVNLSSLFG